VLFEKWIDDLCSYLAQGFERSRFVLTNELAEADHVGREDSGKAAFFRLWSPMSSKPTWSLPRT
jgi:hypothetical protein